MYRESYVSKQGGDDTDRPMQQQLNVAIQDMTPQHPVINWLKLSALLCFTFGLIAIMWAISNAIQHMKGASTGTIVSSFQDAGGLILGMFLFYVCAFGIAWRCGSGKRDQLRREAVEKQIAKERALQALQNIQ